MQKILALKPKLALLGCLLLALSGCGAPASPKSAASDALSISNGTGFGTLSLGFVKIAGYNAPVYTLEACQVGKGCFHPLLNKAGSAPLLLELKPSATQLQANSCSVAFKWATGALLYVAKIGAAAVGTVFACVGFAAHGMILSGGVEGIKTAESLVEYIKSAVPNSLKYPAPGSLFGRANGESFVGRNKDDIVLLSSSPKQLAFTKQDVINSIVFIAGRYDAKYTIGFLKD